MTTKMWWSALRFLCVLTLMSIVSAITVKVVTDFWSYMAICGIVWSLMYIYGRGVLATEGRG